MARGSPPGREAAQLGGPGIDRAAVAGDGKERRGITPGGARWRRHLATPTGRHLHGSIVVVWELDGAVRIVNGGCRATGRGRRHHDGAIRIAIGSRRRGRGHELPDQLAMLVGVQRPPTHLARGLNGQIADLLPQLIERLLLLAFEIGAGALDEPLALLLRRLARLRQDALRVAVRLRQELLALARGLVQDVLRFRFEPSGLRADCSAFSMLSPDAGGPLVQHLEHGLNRNRCRTHIRIRKFITCQMTAVKFTPRELRISIVPSRSLVRIFPCTDERQCT